MPGVRAPLTELRSSPVRTDDQGMIPWLSFVWFTLMAIGGAVHLLRPWPDPVQRWHMRHFAKDGAYYRRSDVLVIAGSLVIAAVSLMIALLA